MTVQRKTTVVPLTPTLPKPLKTGDYESDTYIRSLHRAIRSFYKTLALRLDKQSREGPLADRPKADGTRGTYFATDTAGFYIDYMGVWYYLGTAVGSLWQRDADSDLEPTAVLEADGVGIWERDSDDDLITNRDSGDADELWETDGDDDLITKAA